MDTQRLAKLWARVQRIVMVLAALGLTVLAVMDWISPTAAAEPGMPWWQFAAFIVPILAIFAVCMYFESRKSSQVPRADAPKPYFVSADMQGFARFGKVFVLISAGFALLIFGIKLGNGVGTREWFSSLCVVLLVVACIPTWVHEALVQRKKTPEPAA